MEAAIPKMPLSGLLSLTKAQLHSQYPRSLRYDRIVVGAIIFQPSTTTGNRLLLLKRAAHDPAFPNMFAIPGGHVEDTDLSIFRGLKREVFEETTMSIQAVIDQVDPLAWVTLRRTQGTENVSESKYTSLQMSFVCNVEGVTFQVDPEEHSMGVWADREEAAKLEMSEGMRGVVDSAFKWKEAELEKASKF